jgi:hypothetical protein
MLVEEGSGMNRKSKVIAIATTAVIVLVTIAAYARDK